MRCIRTDLAGTDSPDVSVRDGRDTHVHRTRGSDRDLVIRTESTEGKHDGEHIYGGGSHRAREWNGAFRDGGAVFLFLGNLCTICTCKMAEMHVIYDLSW